MLYIAFCFFIVRRALHALMRESFIPRQALGVCRGA